MFLISTSTYNCKLVSKPYRRTWCYFTQKKKKVGETHSYSFTFEKEIYFFFFFFILYIPL